MIEELALELIRRDGGTQPRAFMNTVTVMDYTEILQEGGYLPPVDVFYDGTDYWLADGYHRIQAAKEVGFKSFSCIVHQGDVKAAQWFSFGANKDHGLRRTNADKQRTVEAALEHPASGSMTDSDIADHCGVNRRMVLEYRKKHLVTGSQDSPARTVTRKGKQYQQNVANIGKAKAPKAEAEPVKAAEPTAPTPEPQSAAPTFRTEKVTPFPAVEKITAAAAIHGAITSLRKTPPDVESALRELESADI